MKKITLTLALTVMATLAFCQTKITMEKKNGVYLIPCIVNGLKLNFIFDTGAGDVSVSLSEAVFMIKNGYMKEEDLIGTEYYRIANGDVAEGTKIIIRKLEIGNKTLYNVEASIVHTLSAPLLLGQSAIERFGKFSIDYSTNTLVLGGGTSEQQISTNQTKVVEQNNIPAKTIDVPVVKTEPVNVKKEPVEQNNIPTKTIDVPVVKTEPVEQNNIPAKTIDDVPVVKTEPVYVKKEPVYCDVCNDKILITSEITNTIARANKLYFEAKFRQSAEEYNSILAKFPNYCVAYYNRGLGKYYAGDKEGAKYDFEKSLLLGLAETKQFLSTYYGK
ncbi:MAG: hypothetical protein EXR20_08800 [Bacteroidetes bacterium]|nr:hypothetical protein [Bacteroidota bacterium]